jgi:SDR family mycofactocin-dependent oxidoreductase
MSKTDRFKGKVVLISGIARGQGRNHAVRFAAEGADVIGFDICRDVGTVPYSLASADDLRETEKLVHDQGRQIVTAVADVRDFSAVQRCVSEGVTRFGRLDVIVANAGIGVAAHRLHEFPEQTWQDMIDINLTGVWHTCKAGIPHLVAGRRGGAIVITSSGAGLRGRVNSGHYVAAKHGIVGLMRSLANELAADIIRVNSVHPSNVNTDMLLNPTIMRLFRPDVAEPSLEEFAVAAREMHAIPVPWVEVDDVSNAILFLASDEARYITGVTLPVDAGFANK